MAFSGNGWISRTHDGGPPKILYGLFEANSQSFKKGQLVYAAGGTVTGAVTAVATDGSAVLGFALADATNVTSGHIEIPVMLIYPGDEVVLPTTNNGTAYSAALFLPLTKYGLYVASNVSYADFNDTSNDRVTFLRPLYDGAGNAKYFGVFHFLDGVLQTTAGI